VNNSLISQNRKKILLISPNFPPVNTADMQRARMSLPFFDDFGWDVQVVMVDPLYSDSKIDELLLESLPREIKIHKVKAFSKKWTSKIGLGNLGIRSLYYYYVYVNNILRTQKVDLIYFSTTLYPVCILGRFWKYKFGVPYVIDIQDPWHSDYYKNKPKNERPPKYWFSYRLNKYLEPIALKNVDGLIAVSEAYIDELKNRYFELKNIPSRTITFGVLKKDFEIAFDNAHKIKLHVSKVNGFYNLAYIGVVGIVMQKSLNLLFKSFKIGLITSPEVFQLFKMHFIGTSYAPNSDSKKSVIPLALKYGLNSYVFEETSRIGFYEVISNLQSVDGLLVIGTDDSNYTASKLYPYIMINKPLLAVLNPLSSAVTVMKKCNAGDILYFDEDVEISYNKFKYYLENIINNIKYETNWQEFEKYTAKEMTRRQCELFDKVIESTI